MKAYLLKIYLSLLNIIFPRECQSCKTKLSYDSRLYLCTECSKKTELELSLATTYPEKGFSFKKAFHCYKYKGLVKNLIQSYKFKNSLFLKDTLCELFCRASCSIVDYTKIDLILSVPLHEIDKIKRSFNQSDIFAKALAKRVDIRYDGDILFKQKKTHGQIKLSRKMRLRNLRNAFDIKDKEPIQNKNILLIDDVFTTGATVDECSKTLLSSGAKNIYALTFLRGN